MSVDFSDLDELIAAPIRADAPNEPHKPVEPAKFTCRKCNGTGRVTFGYVNVRSGECYACGGRGFHKQPHEKRVAANAKRKATAAANLASRTAEFHEEHPGLIERLAQIAEWHDFARSLVEQFNDRGRLTENQIAAAYRALAKVDERRQQRREQRRAENSAKSGELDISGVAKLFETAVDNDIKRPVFRAEGMQISKASARSANAGALYVKSAEGIYYGKIVDGGKRFLASREAPAETLEKLRAIAADPTGEAIKYARRTGRCSCCGRGLVDPVSIRAGIGPICAERWGLDFRRELAAEELTEEAGQR